MKVERITRVMSRFSELRLVSYLAPSLFWFYKATGAYLERVLNIKTKIEQSEFDPLDDLRLSQDQWDLAFICGLPFVRYRTVAPDQLRALVAPVMQAERYQNRPIYFADVIVSTASGLATFGELAGKTLCYNDCGSNSGYHLLRQRLIEGKYPKNFFGKTLPSGFHQQSIHWVVEGLADCAAIDSTILEQELQDFPNLAERLRVVESIGPCPMPPLVVSQRLSAAVIQQLQTALLQPDAELQAAMQQAQIRRFAAVQSEDYKAIAISYNAAIDAGYEVIG